MKKFFIASILFILFSYIDVMAADIHVEKSNISLYINEVLYKSSSDLININDSVYLSNEDIYKIFSYNCIVNCDNKKVKLTYENTDKSNNDSITTDFDICYDLYIENVYLGKSYIFNNKIYIPLRLVADRCLCETKWNENANAINIKYNLYNIEGREQISNIIYDNSIGYNYIFSLYQNIVNGEISIFAIEYEGFINDSNKYAGFLDINKAIDKKFININNDKYKILINKINDLLNDEEKGNKVVGYWTTGQCDFSCHIRVNDKKIINFDSLPEIETTSQYNELKNFLKNISNYKMEYITPHNI